VTRLERSALARNTAATSLRALGFDGLVEVCRRSSGRHAPDRRAATEPRSGFPIVYSEARAERLALDPSVCVVCENLTCPAVDLAELPGGDLAYLTPNLYPIAFPHAEPADLFGVHLVHWSSLRHDGGLPGADDDTAAALLRQLADAEELLLHDAPPEYPAAGEGHRGHVGIIKNRGRRVGGSVEHDHQQILLCSAAPAEPAATVGLGPRLLEQTPDDLVVDRIDDRVTTLVPTFMRRPLHAFVVPRGPAVGWLHHMPEDLLRATGRALARLTAATSRVMEARHGEPAWNLVCHAGAGCGPVFEMRAFTQPLGGYEHLGIYLCEERPATTAGRLRDALV